MRDLDAFLKHLKCQDVEPGTIVDVGTCYGTPPLYNQFPNAYHIFVEPNPSFEERLKLLCNKFDGEYHLVALSDERGVLQFEINSAKPELGTLGIGSKFGGTTGDQYKFIKVETKTLDDLIDGRDLPKPMLLKTDCQGYDRNVLLGGIRCLSSFEVVIAEANVFHISDEQATPVIADVVGTMKSMGFEVYDILTYSQRPLDDALGYLDIAFINRNSILWSKHGWSNT